MSARKVAQMTKRRKDEHIHVNLNEDVRAKGIQSGFERYRLLHCAAPEINLDEVDTSVELLERKLHSPILISSMTGGTALAKKINARLARVAQEHRFAMALGSCRLLLEDDSVLRSFAVRKHAADILLFANLGAVQLNYGVSVDDCRKLVDVLEVDALVLHLNPLQEALQPEGNTRFRGVLSRIEDLCRSLHVPIIVKEVGWGISGAVADRLKNVGVFAIDVAGAGGTSWSEVERVRSLESWQQQCAASFAGWGIPTAETLVQVRLAAPDIVTIASGGIKSGIDIAKGIALGATLAGIASPFLQTAVQSEKVLHDCAKTFTRELRVAMFACGCKSLNELRSSSPLSWV